MSSCRALRSIVLAVLGLNPAAARLMADEPLDLIPAGSLLCWYGQPTEPDLRGNADAAATLATTLALAPEEPPASSGLPATSACPPARRGSFALTCTCCSRAKLWVESEAASVTERAHDRADIAARNGAVRRQEIPDVGTLHRA